MESNLVNKKIAAAWNEHSALPFPVSIQTYHSAPENKDKNIQLALLYASGGVHSFVKNGRISEQQILSLAASKQHIQDCLDIQDEAGRVYLEFLNEICADVLSAVGYSEGQQALDQAAGLPKVVTYPVEEEIRFENINWVQIGLSHIGVPRKKGNLASGIAYCYAISTGHRGVDREPCWILAAVSEDAVATELKRVSRTPQQNLNELKYFADSHCSEGTG